MITYRLLAPSDLTTFRPQQSQEADVAKFLGEEGWMRTKGINCVAEVGGEVIALFGFIPFWLDGKRCGYIWAVFSASSGKYFVPLIRRAKRMLIALGGWDLYTPCKRSYPERGRLAAILGMSKDSAGSWLSGAVDDLSDLYVLRGGANGY